MEMLILYHCLLELSFRWATHLCILCLSINLYLSLHHETWIKFWFHLHKRQVEVSKQSKVYTADFSKSLSCLLQVGPVSKRSKKVGPRNWILVKIIFSGTFQLPLLLASWNLIVSHCSEFLVWCYSSKCFCSTRLQDSFISNTS